MHSEDNTGGVMSTSALPDRQLCWDNHKKINAWHYNQGIQIGDLMSALVTSLADLLNVSARTFHIIM